jgi:PilZ domain
MSIGLALLVSADSDTIQHFSHALQELSITPEVCREVPAAMILLNRRKYDAVIVDLQLEGQSAQILDETHHSASNRTAVTFAITSSDAESTAAFRKTSGFVFERPLSIESVRSTLRPAYGLILRERRRYFRCPVSVPVVVVRRTGPEVRCYTVNISEGGMALSTFVPLQPGEQVQVQFTLPGHKVPCTGEATICWWKTGQLGVRLVCLSEESKAELQVWLSSKLEELLPGFVAETFQKADGCSNSKSGTKN